jgi:hypothetical protein
LAWQQGNVSSVLVAVRRCRQHCRAWIDASDATVVSDEIGQLSNVESRSAADVEHRLASCQVKRSRGDLATSLHIRGRVHRFEPKRGLVAKLEKVTHAPILDADAQPDTRCPRGAHVPDMGG